MVKRRSTLEARKIWVASNGEIGRCDLGFRKEIHHINGDPNDNHIENLSCVSIMEHLEIHIRAGDYGAAGMIARRMGLGPFYMSEIQRGKKRPGVGGRPKGSPGNKNFRWSDEAKKMMSEKRRGKRHAPLKISDEEAAKIKEDHSLKINIPSEYIIFKENTGKKTFRTYTGAYCDYIAQKYNVNRITIKNIVSGKRKIENINS